MSEAPTPFALLNLTHGDPPPVLVGVEAKGRLDATLFELTLRQRYRNTQDKPLEVLYTFPVPIESTLLGFASELNGVRKVGQVVPHRMAAHQYESALDSGDAPVMLQSLHDGTLFNVSIGNLNLGDEIVLEVRFAQLLRFDQGRLRLSIPSTIAPRYGNPVLAHLEPQQVPQVSLDVNYPLSLDISISAALNSATVTCPTHTIATRIAEGGGRVFTLSPGAVLDRDVVLVLSAMESRPSLMIHAIDPQNPDAPVVVVATFQPPPPATAVPLNLKVLVDCSGSMNGDSIESAKRAVQGVVAQLQYDDTLSLSRFGGSVEHLLAPTPANPQTLRFLRPVMAQIAADMGGTEMGVALQAVCELSGTPSQQPSDILLISDGEVWNVDEMLKQVRASKHRVFVIGVGHAPAQGLLRTLAEASGGACEFATPGEGLEEAAQRMLLRMRQPGHRSSSVDWGQEPVWTCGPNAPVFGGDSLMVMAGFKKAPDPRKIRLLVTSKDATNTELARCETQAPCPGDALARVAAGARLKEANRQEAAELAVRYQLITADTRCLLVHERAEADKASEAATLYRVSHMLAAGWGGFGSGKRGFFGSSFGGSSGPAFGAAVDLFSPSIGTTFDRIPEAMLRLHPLPILQRLDASAPSNAVPPAVALSELRTRLCQHLAHGGSRDDIRVLCSGIGLPAAVYKALARILSEGLNADVAWQVLAHWVVNHGFVARRDLPTSDWIAGLDTDTVARCLVICTEEIGQLSSDMPGTVISTEDESIDEATRTTLITSASN